MTYTLTSLCKFQGLLKEYSTVFKDYQSMTYTFTSMWKPEGLLKEYSSVFKDLLQMINNLKFNFAENMEI